jgi:4-hydroxy-tetrahydrodipicolinate synthase
MFQGCLTALVTPFRRGEIDHAALAELVERQIAAGINGLVPCGSTGEAATLTHDEHVEVVRAVVRVARRRVPVMAGTGSNSTAEAIRLTRGAEEAGADAALLISPYYNKPTQAGIVQHFQAVAAATKLPLVVYNIPGRTASNLLPETLIQLSRVKNIVGVKEASGSMSQIQDVIAGAGPDFAVFAGDDQMTLPIVAAGGCGAIAVASNVAPKEMTAIVDALLANDMPTARTRLYALLPLVRALNTLEVNPLPVKTALAMLGLCAEEFRLPLTPMSPGPRAALEAVLRERHLV